MRLRLGVANVLWSAGRRVLTDTLLYLSSPVILSLHACFIKHRAGELNSDELERIVTILQNPAQFKIPTWFLNRQKDIIDGKNSQILSNQLDSKLREDLERLKRIRNHRGIRHYWGVKVRGQHTCTTGRRGRVMAGKKK